jgi:hypothetical protein
MKIHRYPSRSNDRQHWSLYFGVFETITAYEILVGTEKPPIPDPPIRHFAVT